MLYISSITNDSFSSLQDRHTGDLQIGLDLRRGKKRLRPSQAGHSTGLSNAARFRGGVIVKCFYVNMRRIPMTWRIRIVFVIASIAALVLPSADGVGNPPPSDPQPIIFASFAESPQQVEHVRLLATSIRTFAGAYKDAPVRLYAPAGLVAEGSETLKSLAALGVEVRHCTAPETALWLFFAAKVYAAVQAEADAVGEATILAWLDDDTIVLQQPDEFLLPPGKNLGYRPVMHKNVGLFYNEPMDAFWGRTFELLGVKESSIFPVVTPADGDTLRTYINAGCLAVRPERGLLGQWAACFSVMHADPELTEMCRQDSAKRIFIHQVALTGAILTHLTRHEMVEFSDRINYPIFFESMFGAKRDFRDLTDVVTFRHESYFKDPAPDWESQLRGPADRIAWIKTHITVTSR
jgi:hypothetical protein